MLVFMRRRPLAFTACLLTLFPMIVSKGRALSPEVLAPPLLATPHLRDHKVHVQHSASQNNPTHSSVSPTEAVKIAVLPTRADLLHLVANAATANKLPPDYLKRLIRQESGFDERAVSVAGAQGIAQFMPATARDRGLKDPFDPAEALPKSAELLRDLKRQFGNLGLAAAAYNAGPRRVQDWLDGVGYLPRETWTYVYAVTGRPANAWAPAGIHVALAQPDEGLQAISGARNWELALLLELAGTQNQKLPTAGVTGTRTRHAPAHAIRARFAAEAALCTSCIIQPLY